MAFASPPDSGTVDTGPSLPTISAEPNDLGFGSVVASGSRRRLLNRDGTFNVVRRGPTALAGFAPYHALLTMSWARFIALLAAAFVVVNSLFAIGFLLCGPNAIARTGAIRALEPRVLDAFFFSVHTVTTVGYGNFAPATLAANLLVTLETLVGLIGYALAYGLVFARFARPSARIAFSDVAIVAPYRDGTAFEFRIANRRHTQLIELEAQVSLSWLEGTDRQTKRVFHDLPLERTRVALFPLSWTVVHPIDERSPLHGVTAEQLAEADAEFFVLLTGIDETSAQPVHARSSYKSGEIVWGARFADIFRRDQRSGITSIDLRGIGAIELTEE